MALTLSARAELLSQQVNIAQQLILEIDGIDLVFGAVDVTKLALFDDAGLFFDMPNLFFDGVIYDERSRPYISLGGTTKSITQQLNQDKGGTGSISAVKIELIDKDGELTDKFTPASVVADVLSKRAEVYIAFQGGAHPEDSIKIFSGLVDDMEFGAGKVMINIAHPEQLKRQTLFEPIKTKLNGAINASALPVVDSNQGMLLPSVGNSYLRTYLRIDDELIQYSSFTGDTTFGGVVRGALGTTAASHGDNADVETFYVLEGDAVNLALVLMLSGVNGNFVEGLNISAFNEMSPTLTVPNAVLFPNNVVDKYGLVIGDRVQISGATNPANDSDPFTWFNIIDMVVQDDGSSYLVLDGTFVDENDSPAVAGFRSQYDVMVHGAKMTPREVDVAEHIRLNNLFGSNFHTYKFYLREEIKLSEFLSEEIYFPSGMYALPRKGKASVGYTAPPLATSETKVIDSSSVVRPDQIKIGRSINKNFYNAVIYKFDDQLLEEKFSSSVVTTDEDSNNRIPVGNRPLKIEAKGIRTENGGVALLQLQARRFLDRYKFAAESLQVEIMYGDGFNIEVGDTVIFGDSNLQISDITRGDRQFEPRLMEVTNKALDIGSGKIRLTLTDTAFDLDGRFGSVSPASIVKSGATTSVIPLERSYGWNTFERKKWSDYIGLTVLVRSADYVTSGTSVLTGFDPVVSDAMVLNPALSFTPAAGYIVEPVGYDSAEEKWKRIHCFLTPTVDVVSGASATSLDVGAGDIGKFYVGSIIRVHNSDYTLDSDEVKVTNITGTTLTVEDMGFTPSSSEVVDLIGFTDEGQAYRLI